MVGSDGGRNTHFEVLQVGEAGGHSDPSWKLPSSLLCDLSATFLVTSRLIKYGLAFPSRLRGAFWCLLGSAQI